MNQEQELINQLVEVKERKEKELREELENLEEKKKEIMEKIKIVSKDLRALQGDIERLKKM